MKTATTQQSESMRPGVDSARTLVGAVQTALADHICIQAALYAAGVLLRDYEAAEKPSFLQSSAKLCFGWADSVRKMFNEIDGMIVKTDVSVSDVRKAERYVSAIWDSVGDLTNKLYEAEEIGTSDHLSFALAQVSMAVDYLAKMKNELARIVSDCADAERALAPIMESAQAASTKPAAVAVLAEVAERTDTIRAMVSGAIALLKQNDFDALNLPAWQATRILEQSADLAEKLFQDASENKLPTIAAARGGV